MFWVLAFVVFVVWWAIAALVLDGANHRQFDGPVGEYFDSHPDDTAANTAFMAKIGAVRKQAMALKSVKKGMALVRDFADKLSDDMPTDSEFSPAGIDGVEAEWALAEGADPKRRILFFHGGAFILGSPRGHRAYADQLSKIANAAVLSVDYRMLPENTRMSGIEDAQNAYLWILENGPEGPEDLDLLLVSGDSAGGNLTLMISGWTENNAPRRPDGIIAFSPSADTTMASPTVKSNRLTDPILGEGLGMLRFIPRPLLLWVMTLTGRMKPSNPLNSPLFYELSNLPKTLIHASSSEMLLGESIRYTNKAQAAGSDVKLQIWKDQLHDWHLFNMGQGSANTAWAEVDKFIKSLA